MQSIYQYSTVSLHAQSLKYSRLHNSVFLAVSSMGGSGRVVRSRWQVWMISMSNSGGEVDITLRVNSYIWILKHLSSEAATSTTKLEAFVSSSIYLSQNDKIAPATRREIAQIAGGIRGLVEAKVQVDEETVMRAYKASLEDAELHV